MPSTDAVTSDVELTSLVHEDGRNSPASCGGEDEQVDGAPAGHLPAGSGCSGPDASVFLLCVFCLAAGTSLAAAKFLGTTARGGAPSEEADARWRDMRWEPASTNWSANCHPRYRLADGAIHCDSPPTNASDGGAGLLCGGVPMEPGSCILPILGRWVPRPSPPAPPLARRFGVNSSRASLPRCRTMPELLNGTYDYEGDPADLDAEWVPNTCSVVPLSPFVWTQNSGCETTITMMGDSHIRNLFTATINGLRGVKYFTEAHADDANKGRGIASTYEWRLLNDGGAVDRMGWHANIKAEPIAPFEDCPCGEVKKCLRVAFIWAPTFGEQLAVMHYATEWRSDVLVVEPGNAYEHNTVLSPDWTARLDSMLRENGRLRIGILHFIWGRQPAGERAKALEEWISNGAMADRVSYLGQNSMSPNSKQGRATFHFACGLGKKVFESDTITAAEPCTDLADTSQIKALITVLYGALSEKAKRSP